MSEDKPKIDEAELSVKALEASPGEDSFGEIQVSERVFEHIAFREATQVEGVIAIGADAGLVDDLRGWMKKGAATKGVRIRQDETGFDVDVSITVEYGRDIKAVATSLQERLMDALHKMAGSRPRKVNIHLLALVDPRPTPEPPAAPKAKESVEKKKPSKKDTPPEE